MVSKQPLAIFVQGEESKETERVWQGEGVWRRHFYRPAVLRHPTLLGSACISQPRHSSAARLGRVLMTCIRPIPMATLINGPLAKETIQSLPLGCLSCVPPSEDRRV